VFGTIFFNRIQDHGLPFSAAQLVYWLGAGILVVTWALALMVPNTARSEDEIMI